jgi:protein TonB
VKRLAVAAMLAFGIHAILLGVDMPWKQPVLLMPQSRAVDISLVTFQKPVQRPVPPKPIKVPPKPKTESDRPPRPIPKPVVQPRRTPDAVQPEPAPEPSPAMAAPMPETPVEEAANEAAMAIPDENAPLSNEEHAAVQVSVPLYDINPSPVYPLVARRRNYQGTVLLDVRVTADGKAAEVKVAQSSGYKVLDKSALSAVQGWRFEPARRGALPMETWVQVPVKFELK